MEYYGEVGGLRVMFSPEAILGGSSLGPRLCESGGDGGRGKTWRNPTLSELGMLLTGPSVTVLTLTVGDSISEPSSGPANGLPGGTPGNGGAANPPVVNMTFPATVDARGGLAAALRSSYPSKTYGSNNNEFRAVSGVYDNAGEPLALVLNTATSQANLDDRTEDGVAVCVMETAAYPNPSPHNQLAGVRLIKGDGDGIALSVSAITASGVSYGVNPLYTLTVQGYFFHDTDPDSTSFEVSIKALASVALSADFGDSTNDSGFYALASPVINSDGNTEIVVSGKTPGTAPTSEDAKDLEIQVTPPLGKPVTFTVEFPNF